MRRTPLLLLSMLAVIHFGSAAQAAPQTPAEQPSAPQSPGEPARVSPRLNLTLEQRHMIKEIIKDVKAKSSSAEFQPTIGEPVPAGIDLQPMPPEVAQKVPQIKSHVFFLIADQFVIVDPKDSKVAEVIKLGEN
jgi:hypothetical protein